MDFIVCGKYIITMNEKDEVIENGAVVVRDGRIVDVGEFSETLKKYKEKPFQIFGNSYSAVMPGFINTHTHAAMVLFRGIADDLPLKKWLTEYIWPKEAKFLSAEFVYDGTQLACLEMLKRGVIGQGVLDFQTVAGSTAQDYLKKAEEFINKYRDDELILPAVAPHAIYTCSRETQ